MKLVEILAKELEEWPSNTDSVWQDYDGEIRALGNRDTSFTSMFLTEICDDCLREKYDTTPRNRVTKKMWEAEKAKMIVQNIPEAESFDPIYCRDRIKEIDALVESLEEERVSLVQALEDEGFVLVSTALVSVEPIEDMSDWCNWKVGDSCEVVDCGGWKNQIGEIVVISEIDGDAVPIKASGIWYWPKMLKFHSRPRQ